MTAAGAAGDRTEFRRRRAGDSTRANIGGKLTTGDEGVHLRVARGCAGLRRPTACIAYCALARSLLLATPVVHG